MRLLILLFFSVMMQLDAVAQDEMQLIDDVARLQQQLKSPRHDGKGLGRKRVD